MDNICLSVQRLPRSPARYLWHTVARLGSLPLEAVREGEEDHPLWPLLSSQRSGNVSSHGGLPQPLQILKGDP